MKKGFTLIEVMIYTALALLIVGGTLYYLVAISQTRAKAGAIMELQATERLVLSQLKVLIKESEAIEWSASIVDQDIGSLVVSDAQGQFTTVSVDNEGRLMARRAGRDDYWHGLAVRVVRWRLTKLDDKTVMIDLELRYLDGLPPYGYTVAWRSAFSLGK